MRQLLELQLQKEGVEGFSNLFELFNDHLGTSLFPEDASAEMVSENKARLREFINEKMADENTAEEVKQALQAELPLLGKNRDPSLERLREATATVVEKTFSNVGETPEEVQKTISDWVSFSFGELSREKVVTGERDLRSAQAIFNATIPPTELLDLYELQDEIENNEYRDRLDSITGQMKEARESGDDEALDQLREQ